MEEKPMVNIWLDDIRPAPVGWLWAKTADECNGYLNENKGNVNMLSLDHDLGDDEVFGTGFSVCKYLIAYDKCFPRKIYLHTANPIGRENMYGLLINYKQVFNIDVDLYYGPNLAAWEQSIDIARSMGWIL
jgi:hypothetical protein